MANDTTTMIVIIDKVAKLVNQVNSPNTGSMPNETKINRTITAKMVCSNEPKCGL